VLAAVPDAGTSGLLDVPEDQLDRMRKQAEGFGQERLARAAETISAGLVEMRGATSPRLLLELMCAQVLLPAGPVPHGPAQAGHDSGGPVTAGAADLAARVERLERQLAAAAAAAPASGARPAPSGARQAAAADPGHEAAITRQRERGSRPPDSPRPGPAPRDRPHPGSQAAAAVAAAVDADTLRSRWPDVLEAVRDVRRTAWILLSNYADIDSLEGNVLNLAFDSEGNAKGFASTGSDGYLSDVLHAMFGVRLVIRAVVLPAGPRGRNPAITRGPQDRDPDRGARPGPGTDAGPGPGAAGGRGDPATGRPDRQSQRPGAGEPRANPGSRASGGDVARTRPSGQVGGGQAGGEPAARAGVRAVADPADRARPAAEAPAGRAASGVLASREPTTRHEAGARTRSARPAESDLRDDPRPHTDATPPGADDLIGTDLIMRELGGHVIDEATEV